jgi:hypothetical protein
VRLVTEAHEFRIAIVLWMRILIDAAEQFLFSLIALFIEEGNQSIHHDEFLSFSRHTPHRNGLGRTTRPAAVENSKRDNLHSRGTDAVLRQMEQISFSQGC